MIFTTRQPFDFVSPPDFHFFLIDITHASSSTYWECRSALLILINRIILVNTSDNNIVNSRTRRETIIILFIGIIPRHAHVSLILRAWNKISIIRVAFCNRAFPLLHFAWYSFQTFHDPFFLSRVKLCRRPRCALNPPFNL